VELTSAVALAAALTIGAPHGFGGGNEEEEEEEEEEELPSSTACMGFSLLW
jgi:ribosomal protein L12E/L44/L45/RPP1/RPP2